MRRNWEGLATGALVCVLLLSAGACFWEYSRNMSRVIRQGVDTSLRTLSSYQKNALTAELDGRFQMLALFGVALSEQTEQPDVIEDMLLRAGTQLGTAGVAGFIWPDGTGLMSDGSRLEGLNRGVAAQAMLGTRGVARVEDAQAPYFVFAQPVRRAEKIVGAAIVAYTEEYFTGLLGAEPLGEENYAFLTSSDGAILARPENQSYLSMADNALDFYGEVALENGATDEGIARDLAEGKGGMLTYSYGNQHRYVTYAPLGLNDWYLFSAMPGVGIEQQMAEVRRRTLGLAAQLALVVAMLGTLLAVLSQRKDRRLAALERKYDESEKLRKTLAQMSYTILFEADPKTGEISYNDSFERQLGRKPLITNFKHMPQDDGKSPVQDIAMWRRLADEMSRGVPKSQISVQMAHRNGAKIWYRVSFVCVYDEKKSAPLRIVGRIANIEWQEHEQDRQVAGAECDALTGLMGHMAFMQRAAKRLEREGKPCAMLIADIDDFKGARDIDGRYQGDRLLVRMSEAMRKVFGEDDLLGRLGGDTFAVLMTDGADPEYIAQCARTLCELFEEEGGHTCSIGVAMSGSEAQTISELSRRADKALYRAKLAGKHRYEFYEALVREETARRPRATGDANSVLLRCATSLLTCDALPVGMDEALREVAEYYQADHAYVLEAAPDGEWIHECYGWYAPGQGEEGNGRHPAAGLGALMSALKERRTITLSEISETTVHDHTALEALRARNVRAIYMVPMGKSGAPHGLIGIDNPRAHVGNVSLLRTIASYAGSALAKNRVGLNKCEGMKREDEP